jgi:hypothetical protein
MTNLGVNKKNLCILSWNDKQNGHDVCLMKKTDRNEECRQRITIGVYSKSKAWREPMTARTGKHQRNGSWRLSPASAPPVPIQPYRPIFIRRSLTGGREAVPAAYRQRQWQKLSTFRDRGRSLKERPDFRTGIERWLAVDVEAVFNGTTTTLWSGADTGFGNREKE